MKQQTITVKKNQQQQSNDTALQWIFNQIWQLQVCYTQRQHHFLVMLHIDGASDLSTFIKCL